MTLISIKISEMERELEDAKILGQDKKRGLPR
jgi:hypothetical protein